MPADTTMRTGDHAPTGQAPQVTGPGRPAPLGLTPVPGGVNAAVFSAHAERIELCLFDAAGIETARLPLPHRTGPVHHAHIAGIGPGQAYGLRAHGPWAPEAGHRFDPAKLLLDPYARALNGRVSEDPALYTADAPGTADSAPFMPRAVVTAPAPRTISRPHRPWAETVIYEAHLKGLTKAMPGIPPEIAGTWDALAHPRLIEHLTDLGITALELLPVQAIRDDAFLLARGLVNYWGYATLAFLAPEPRYLGPAGIAGIRTAIDALHDAGIEVILDVVYNHTAEGAADGPTLSLRGLDNASYYRLLPDDPAAYVNDTGCGNTVDATHPFALRLILDSLRHWATEYGVDGFRFDLMTALEREDDGFDPRGGFLDALMQDPVLSGLKLIAEPWDLGPGGYRLGGYPAGMAEWNDRFRDDVRRFWRGDEGTAPGLAARLLGSAEVFDHGARPAWSSVNFVTAHDGFTLADLTAYAAKRNAANGEENRDGRDENFADAIGGEGPDDAVDDAARDRRARRRRNLLATLFLAQGTPMLLAGDEAANTQGGNNNAYAQDNPTGWTAWAPGDPALTAFIRRLIALRRAHPVLRQPRFLHGRHRPSDNARDVEWRGLAGGRPHWEDAALPGFALRLRGSAEAEEAGAPVAGEELLLAFNRADAPARLSLPRLPAGRRWLRLLDTAAPEAEAIPAGRHPVMLAESVAVFAAAPTARTGR